jgi:hypothetical protein
MRASDKSRHRNWRQFVPVCSPNGALPSARVSPSQPYTVGRIDFTGHPHYSDSVIRSHFPPDEGVPLDQFLPRRSGARNLSGPVCPMSPAGPLRVSVSSRLPPWGQGLVELSTYTFSFNLFAFSRRSSRCFRSRPKKPCSRLWPWSGRFCLGQAGFPVSPLPPNPVGIVDSRGLVPELPVTVRSPTGDATLFCQPANPRLGTLRTAGGVALQLLGALSGI